MTKNTKETIRLSGWEKQCAAARISKTGLKRAAALLCALAIAAGSIIGIGAPEPVLAVDKAALEQSIKENKAAIENANKEKAALQGGLTDIKKIVESLEGAKKDLQSYVAQLDAELLSIEKKIDELNEKIGDKEVEIERVQNELEEARIVEEEQYEAMKQRIRFIYEQGETYFLEFLLSSKTVGDLLSKTEYVERVTAYDREKLEEFIMARQQVELLEEELNAEVEVLLETKAAAQKEKETMDALIIEKEKQIRQYEAEIGEKEEQVREYEERIASENAQIAALEAAVRASQKELDEANRPKYDGGKFTFPAPSYTRISDDYGNRIHPTLGVKKFHNGIDLAAPTGSPILAAYDGTVVAAEYNATMGNYVMIDHGGSVYTIYMHASSLGVSKGAKVKKGQQIAKVGSTGRSTGPHLHFSVRQDGNYVNPWNFLK